MLESAVKSFIIVKPKPRLTEGYRPSLIGFQIFCQFIISYLEQTLHGEYVPQTQRLCENKAVFAEYVYSDTFLYAKTRPLMSNLQYVKQNSIW